VAEAARYNADLAADPDASGVAVVGGAMELLTALPAGRWTIVTSAARVMVDRWLAFLGLPRPAALVTVDDVERGKPAPDPFLLAAARLGVAPRECLVVEDAPAGIAAGKAAGCTVLAVGSTHEEADLEAADHRTAALADLRATETPEGLLVSW
jgi:sugar-phosphatase